jgi:hypothetical protein
VGDKQTKEVGKRGQQAVAFVQDPTEKMENLTPESHKERDN